MTLGDISKHCQKLDAMLIDVSNGHCDSPDFNDSMTLWILRDDGLVELTEIPQGKTIIIKSAKLTPKGVILLENGGYCNFGIKSTYDTPNKTFRYILEDMLIQKELAEKENAKLKGEIAALQMDNKRVRDLLETFYGISIKTESTP